MSTNVIVFDIYDKLMQNPNPFRLQGGCFHIRDFQCRSGLRRDVCVCSGKYIRLRLCSRSETAGAGAVRMEMGWMQRRHQLRDEVRSQVHGCPRTRRRRKKSDEPPQQQGWEKGSCQHHRHYEARV